MNNKVYKFLLLALVAMLAFSHVGRVMADDEAVATDATDATSSAPSSEEEPAVANDKPEGFSDEQYEAVKSKEEKFEFQAEVSRLMDIIINSLYSNREIFLRELISNASDALDKIRFASLTDKAALGDTPDLEIKVKFDKERNILTIRDTGIGMSRKDLIDHLGVVASSGTSKFVDLLSKGNDGQDTMSLIGQFGVGFYSIYLVSDQCTVISKKNGSPQYIWRSDADKTFSVSADPRGDTLGRGTEIQLHLKEDAREFVDAANLEKIVERYSSFINFPIFLHKSKTVSKEVPVEPEETEEDEADKATKTDDDDVEVKDEAEEDAAPKTKTVSEEVWEWEQLNENQAIWTRSPKEVTKEEYKSFYEALSKDSNGMLSYSHFRAEGEISFKSILYVPKKAASDLYDKYYGKSTSLKLYVRRVLVSDEFEDFMPRYLSFIKGVVDSDDLPINVSRETLSKHRVLKVIAKKMTRKALDMIRKLASTSEKAAEELAELKKNKKEQGGDDDEDNNDDKNKDKDEEQSEEDKEIAKLEERAGRWDVFWKNFGKSIKLGLIEDAANKSKLLKLIRWQSSKSDGKLISLETYVERMQAKQEHIYYITGESLSTVENSPFLEQLRARNLEVFYMVDPLDEYVMSNLPDFDGKKFQSITKEGLKLPEENEEDAKRRTEAMAAHYKSFCDWLKNIFGDKVGKVEPSNRLADSPAVLVTSSYGWSANMERIMKSQTFSDVEKQKYMISQKTLEINTKHPIIRSLKAKADADAEDANAKELAKLVFDAAMLRSGFQISGDDISSFSARVNRVVALGLDISPDAAIHKEDDFDVPDAEESKDEDDAESAVDLDAEEQEQDNAKTEL